jgi:SpoVK/Ycf46/Vps4 family AAA+-type ATPase
MAFEEDIYNRYKDIILKSYNLFPKPKDAYDRVIYVKQRTPEKVYNKFLVETVQWEYAVKRTKLNFTGGDIELICRSLLAAISNMDTNTEDGQYTYMLGNYENIFIKLLKELESS